MTRPGTALIGLLLAMAPYQAVVGQDDGRLEDIVAIGTRAPERSAALSPVPIDVLSANLLEGTGAIELWQQLRRLAPSLNVPHIPIGDNHNRPITLRGLAPHHVLVLVNGKRRHPAATLLAGPSVAATSFTDLAAIPVAAIERIEVLRDGASAQYGSDAIGGVINVVLKTGMHRNLSVASGTVLSSEGGRDFADGRHLQVSGNWGFSRPGGASITLSGELRDKATTNRAYPDRRQQYFAGDPRNGSPARVSSHLGDGSSRAGSLFLAASAPIGAGFVGYTFAGISERLGDSPDAFFRRPLDNRTVRGLHPDGFLPEIGSSSRDQSVVAGVEGERFGWRWDISTGWGRNRVGHDVENSNNASLGAESPTAFDAGEVSAAQWNGNVAAVRSLRVARVPMTVAFGAAARVEQFRIAAGEPDSWRDGGVTIADGPAAGGPAPVGAQGMFGYRPVDQVRARRGIVAGYLELEGRPRPGLLLQAAVRAERYSDFGSTHNGKFAARVDIGGGLALRGSASSGFRAPAMMQQHSSSTRTIFQPVDGINKVLTVRTFPVGSPEARLMGAVPLRPERAINLAAGLVFDRPGLPLITVDIHQVGIADRINLGGSVTDTSIIRLFDESGLHGLGGGNYFSNAIDTRTRGVDIVASQAVVLGSGALRLLAGYSNSRSVVTRVAPPPAQLAAFGSVLFSRTSRGIIENGQPRETIALTLVYRSERLAMTLHNQRSGPTAQLDRVNPAADQHLRARWITDARVAWLFGRNIEVALSGENLFDVYPDEWIDFKHGLAATGVSMQGIFRHPGALSPFGMNGRTVRMTVSVGR